MTTRWKRTHIRSNGAVYALCGATVRAEMEHASRRACGVCMELLLIQCSAENARKRRLLAQFDALTLSFELDAEAGKSISPKKVRRYIAAALDRGGVA